MKRIVDSLLNLFSLAQVLGYAVLIFALSYGYMFLITKHMVVSVIVGFATLLGCFYHSVYLPTKLKREQYLMKELHKYSTSMMFYMQSGHNVLYSLEMSKENLDETIQDEIQKTIDHLNRDAEINTKHFEEYKFSALDIFHQILQIKYKIGGDTKELFGRVVESINFEIVKRDELLRRKRQKRNQVLIMLGLGLSMPVIFVFFANELYTTFLNMGYLAIGLNVSLFILSLISFLLLQRTANDISIYD